MAKQRRNRPGLSAPLRHDDLGDSFPNDWLEAVILAVACFGVFGGIAALVYLSHINGAA